MKNNALCNMINTNNARMGLISSPMNNISFRALDSIAAMDTQMELNAINYSLQYQLSKVMLEQLRKLQKEETKHLNTFV